MSEQLNSAQYRALKPKKANKYGARKVEVDGIVFDSKAEATYYGQLQMRVLIGEVTGFDRQVPFDLIINGQIVCRYIADFVEYYPDGNIKTVDVKGMETPVFKLKRKLMKAVLDIEVTTVKKP